MAVFFIFGETCEIAALDKINLVTVIVNATCVAITMTEVFIITNIAFWQWLGYNEDTYLITFVIKRGEDGDVLFLHIELFMIKYR